MKIVALLLLAMRASASPHPKATPTIVGGTEATQGEFPHLVQIKRNNGQFCGASLLSPDLILTSAQCASSSLAGYTLVAGEHDLTQDEGNEQVRTVSEIIRHPNYNARTNANDLAVMRVSQPFDLTTFVQPTTLPPSNFDPVGQLTAAGWGTLQEGGEYPITLMKVDVPLVSEESCRNAYGNRLLQGMLCAGEDGKDSCQGDTGGPLLSKDILVGITSWGFSCGSGTYPGVYTDVRYFATWIRNQIH